MTCKNNNWMHHGSEMYEGMWMLSPSVIFIGSSYVCGVLGDGRVIGRGDVITDDACYPYSVFPSVYLNTEVKITSGSGTSSDPYILK